jgi:hypothetical protein
VWLLVNGGEKEYAHGKEVREKRGVSQNKLSGGETWFTALLSERASVCLTVALAAPQQGEKAKTKPTGV